jgi:hypothetical protein
MQTTGIEIKVTGTSIADVIKNTKQLVAEMEAMLPTRTTTTAAAPTKKVTKKGKLATVEADDELAGDIEVADEDLMDAEEVEEADDALSFDDATDDEEEIEAPAPKAKAKTKAPKVTDKDVNAAAMAYAKKHGRPATLKVLKSKFKVESVTELSEDDYAKAIQALKV